MINITRETIKPLLMVKVRTRLVCQALDAICQTPRITTSRVNEGHINQSISVQIEICVEEHEHRVCAKP